MQIKARITQIKTPIIPSAKRDVEQLELSYCLWEHKMEQSLWKTEHQFLKCLISVQFRHSVVSNSLQPHGLQHIRLPCPSPMLEAYSNSCPLRWWCHPTVSSSVVPFSSCPQSFPASGSFPVSRFFASGGQSIGVSTSASVLPVFNIHLPYYLGFPGGSMVKNPPAKQEVQVQSLGQEDPLEKEMATHSNILPIHLWQEQRLSDSFIPNSTMNYLQSL